MAYFTSQWGVNFNLELFGVIILLRAIWAASQHSHQTSRRVETLAPHWCGHVNRTRIIAIDYGDFVRHITANARKAQGSGKGVKCRFQETA